MIRRLPSIDAVTERLGVLCARIVLNDPFIDGNKRTAFLTMFEAAETNGVGFSFDDQHDVADQIEAFDAGALAEEQFCQWLRPHVSS